MPTEISVLKPAAAQQIVTDAEAAKTLSETARDQSQGFAQASDSARASSVTAQGLAEAARDLAETYAGVDHRAPTWAALAAISGVTGDIGYVGPDDTGTHTDPIATGTVPNEGLYEWAADGLGSAQAERTGTTGLVGVRPDIDSLKDQIEQVADADLMYAVRDENGDGGLTLDKNSILRTHGAAFETLTVGGVAILGSGATQPGNFAFNIEHIISYGQSLSLGAVATPAISTTQRFDGLMFEGGVLTSHPDDSANYYNSLVPHVETNPADHEDNYNAGETPLAGISEMIKERVSAVQGLDFTEQSYQLLASAPGEGGLSIAQLSDGTVYFTQLEENISNGYSLSQAAGKTYGLRSIFWTQGEEDNSLGTPVATYKNSLTTLLADVDAYAKSVTGQTEDVQLIFYQLQRVLGNGPLVQQALAELSADNAKMHLATPMYQMQYSDAVHLTAKWSKIMGAYYGLCHHRVVVMGEEWQPVRPVGSRRQGNIVEVEFNVPMGGLVIDTDLVPAITNNGFALYAADGTTAITINSVSVSQPNKVRIVAASTIPANAKLDYAWENSADYNCGPTGHRGNLRDSQGDFIVFDGGGINHPMHNWCIMFNQFNIA